MEPQGHIRKIYICSFCRCIDVVRCVQSKINGSSFESKIFPEDEGPDLLLSQEAFMQKRKQGAMEGRGIKFRHYLRH